MTENRTIKTNPVLVAKLRSGKESQVLEALSELNNKGNHLYIPVLVEVLNLPAGEPIRDIILELLSELKDKQSVPLLVEAIGNESDLSIQKDLISCCWKNGLDFAEYLPFFTDLVINAEFETAFEAFTVIDSLINRPGPEERKKEISKIKFAMDAAGEIKERLLGELISVLE